MKTLMKLSEEYLKEKYPWKSEKAIKSILETQQILESQPELSAQEADEMVKMHFM